MKNDTEKNIQNSNSHESENSGLDSRFRYHTIAIALVVFITVLILMGIYYVMFHPDKLSSVCNFLSEIFRPVLFGFVIAYLMTPVLNWMEQKHVKPFIEKKGLKIGSRGLSVLFTAVLCLFALFIVLYLFISQIIPSINDIIFNIDLYSTNISEFFSNAFENYPEIEEQITSIYEFFYDKLESVISTFMDNLSSILIVVLTGGISLLKTVWNLILGFIFALYMIASKEMFVGQARKIVYCVFQEDRANQILADARFVHRTYIGFISGKILDSFIIGCLCLLFTTILGTPYSGLVSLIVGITNVIPFFGPFIGGIPCAILVFVVNPTHPMNMVYFGILILALQLFDGYVLGPRILGNSTGIAGFWVIFSIITFSGFFGVAGMVIGVPTFAVIFAGVRREVNKRLTAKGLSTNRKEYETMDTMHNGEFVIYPKEEKPSKAVHHTLRDIFKNGFKSHH